MRCALFCRVLESYIPKSTADFMQPNLEEKMDDKEMDHSMPLPLLKLPCNGGEAPEARFHGARDEEIICYGAIFPASSEFESATKLKAYGLPWSRHVLFHIRRQGSEFRLFADQANSIASVGRLDAITSKALTAIADLENVSIFFVISSHELHQLSRNRKKVARTLSNSVNIMGPEKLADEVGSRLDKMKPSIYLQHPSYLPAKVRYINPHWFYPDSNPVDLSHFVGLPRVDPEAEEAENVLSSLDNPSHLAMVGSFKESHNLLEIQTPLKQHQEQGIEFILRQETSDLRGSIFSHFVAHFGPKRFQDLCTFPSAGILADVMGLGKTLTTLGAIVLTKADASKFQTDTPIVQEGLPAAKATLIVVPSRQLLDVWKSEIERHLATNALSCVEFHGSSRSKSPESLLHADVVLTTYNTLVADWKRAQVLQKLFWFRVILDEAHWIRNRASLQFKAAADLEAERRWCLTGTPIQNSLSDLCSLLKFLRFRPFSDAQTFEHDIMAPLREGSPANLKLLLGATCLRRNSNYLQLPLKTTTEVSVKMTWHEAQERDRILASCVKECDKIVSQISTAKKYTVLFSTILKLRQLFSHGVLADARPPTTSVRHIKRRKLSPVSDPDIESSCEICNGEDDNLMGLLEGLELCPQCSRNLDDYATKSGTRSSLSPYPDSAISGTSSGHSSPKTPMILDVPEPSKLTAVVRDLEENLSNSKSVVFTTWRATSDRLGEMLERRSIPFSVIDGRVNSYERHGIVSKFQNDSSPRVMLVSIGTGAVGLTLTAANRVHIVEPLWNPAVEDQAIGRVLRIGQTREVTILKYVTAETVEVQISRLQNRKRRLACLVLDENTAKDGSTGALEVKFADGPRRLERRIKLTRKQDLQYILAMEKMDLLDS